MSDRRVLLVLAACLFFLLLVFAKPLRELIGTESKVWRMSQYDWGDQRR